MAKPAEMDIQALKKQTLRTLSKTKASRCSWDYTASNIVSEISSNTAHAICDLDGQTSCHQRYSKAL